MKNKNFYSRAVNNIQLYFVVIMLFCGTAQVSAESMSMRKSTLDYYHEWSRATDEELEALRGGFILPNGVHINLSLERLIRLNDELVRSFSYQLPGEGVILQAGVQNLVSDAIVMPEFSTIIQNGLDSQKIEAMTKIDIEVSNIQGIMSGNGNHRVFTDFVAPALLQ
jgi:hypothetical protein